MDDELRSDVGLKKQGPVTKDGPVGSQTSDRSVEQGINVNGVPPPRKRKRPRTKAYRVHLKDEIERAICSMDSPLHNGVLVEGGGGKSAPLEDVVRALGLLDDKFNSLSRPALAKLGKLSTVFSVEDSAGNPLRIRIEQPSASQLDASTVYLDNLPRDCDVVSLYRRAATFGTVVLLHPLFERNKAGTYDPHAPSTSTQHVQAAFVQFVSQHSATNFCETHSKNWPVKHSCKRRKLRKAKRGLGGRRRILQGTDKTNVQEGRGLRKRKHAVSSHNSDDEAPLKRSRSSQQVTDCLEVVDGKRGCMEKSEQDGVGRERRADGVPGEGVGGVVRNVTAGSNARIRRKRTTKRRRAKFKTKHRVANLSRYFRHMQVLSLQAFREARERYLKLKAESFRRLKDELRTEGVPLNMGSDGAKRARRKRGRAKLMERVVAFREAHMDMQSPPRSTSGKTEGC